MADDKVKASKLGADDLKNLIETAQGIEASVKGIHDIQLLDEKTIKEIVKEYKRLYDINVSIKHITSEEYKISSKILDDLHTRAKIEEEIKKDAKSLVGYIKQIKSINKDIAAIEGKILELQKEGGDENIKAAKKLKEKIKKLGEERDLIQDTVNKTNKWGSGLKLAADAVSAVADGLKRGYGAIKDLGLFEMDKAIKNSAMSMGILQGQSKAFAAQITDAANETISFGVGIEDIAKIQSSYSDTMGRTVLLGKDAAEQMGAMSKATGLGAEGAGEFAGSMDSIGYSAGQTAGYVEDTMNDAHAMGLNSTKVIKSIAQNIKLLNKYNFKAGAKGLAKMVEETQRMGVSVDLVAPMAEKLFNIEGAVEMSAQLQVLGGEWAKLGDPFKLMYKARNDMEGLTKDVINAATATAHFNKENGDFEISSLEMSRLREVAQATGLDFTELAQAAKKAAQYAGIKKQISYGFDEKTEKFIESTAILDEKGKAQIDVDGKGTKKFLSELTAADKDIIKKRADEKESMAQRAKENQTFDDALNNTITLFKQMLLPIVTTLNEKLMPKVKSFVENFNKKGGWGEKIQEFAKVIGSLISTLGGWIIDNPIKSALIYGAAKFTGFLFNTIEWVKNGIALSEGFLAGTGGGGLFKGIGGFLSKMFGGKGVGGGFGGGKLALTEAGEGANVSQAITGQANAIDGAAVNLAKTTKILGMTTKTFTVVGSSLAGLVSGITTYFENKDKGMSTGENLKRSATSGIITGLLSAGLGAIGTALLPGIGTIAGVALGGWLGDKLGASANDAMYGKYDENERGVNDGVIQFNPRDKFMKVNDTTMIAGTNENGNKDLAKQLRYKDDTNNITTMSGSIPNSYSPSMFTGNLNKTLNRPVNNAITQSQIPSNLNVNFGQLMLGGSVELKMGQGYSKELGVQLIHDPEFIRTMTKMINMEVNKNLNGGKPKA